MKKGTAWFEEPAALSPDELASWLALVRLVVRLPMALERTLQTLAGLSHVEYYVLAWLSQAPDQAMRMSDLAAGTDCSVARMTQVVDRLQRRGLVARRSRPTDRRVVEVVLDEAGRDLLEAAAPGHVRHVRGIVLDALDEQEVAWLGDVCRRVLARIADDADRAAVGRRA